MKKIAIILSGCGHLEGTEITEAVTAITTLSKLGAEIQCFAPANALEESNKIARQKAKDLKELSPVKFDALVFPGGYGAAKVLSTWASEGAKCKVLPEIEKIIKAFYQASSPIGALCIAPVLLAKTLGSESVAITIGDDKATADEIEKTGAQHIECDVTDFITDRQHKIITSPAYMYDDASPADVALGIQRAMAELYEMA